jgi:hypothetical protein
MANTRRTLHAERFRHIPEPERLEAGYLEPGRFTPATWQRLSWSEDCVNDVSCYATNHDDLCPVRNDPFRSDNRPTWQWEEMA